jgi:hypothetical protein
MLKKQSKFDASDILSNYEFLRDNPHSPTFAVKKEDLMQQQDYLFNVIESHPGSATESEKWNTRIISDEARFSTSNEKIDWNDENSLRAAFAELEEEETELANAGMSDYVSGLAEIDGE